MTSVPPTPSTPSTPSTPWSPRWREYLLEGWALGTFMLSACAFAVLIFHPQSPASAWPLSPAIRRWGMGAAMGATLAALVYSPWGRRSGAHMNPAYTVSMWTLGRMDGRDGFGYIVAQFVGGALGMALATLVLGAALADPSVHYVVTRPGPAGVALAFAGEFTISAMQMTIVLSVAASQRWQRYTGVCAAVALACYIGLESPWSGTSLNPARTVASAVLANEWTALWLYFVAPLAGMLLASWLHLRRSPSRIPCGKLVHALPCHFCEYVAAGNSSGAPATTAVAAAPATGHAREPHAA